MDASTHLALHALPVALFLSLAVAVSAGKAQQQLRARARLFGGLGLALLALAYLALFRGAPAPAPPAPRAPPRAPEAPFSAAYAPLYLPTLSAPYPLNLNCTAADGSRATCSPAFCTATATNAVNNMAACTGGATVAANPQTYLTSSVKCSACTPSTDARCTTAALTARFKDYSSVYAAFCNAGYLVVISSSDNSFPDNLDNIPFPPGGTLADGSPCRTRSSSIGLFTMQAGRVILTPTALSSASLDNNKEKGAAWYITRQSDGFIFPLPVAGAIGFTVAGQPMFPIFNNRGSFTPEQCEVDGCNAHVGQGGGQPHLHGDPFGPTCLYSQANYASLTVHPPVIGFAFDGYQIYGRHLSTSAEGYSTALDICGGHEHGSYGYHYHPQIIAATTDSMAPSGIATGQAYPATTTGVYQCFRGSLSADVNFELSGPTVTASNPCCSTSAGAYSHPYYVKSGFTFAPTAQGGGGGGAPPPGASASATATVSRTTSPTVSPTRSPPAASASSTVSPSTSPTVSPSRTPLASGASATSTPSPSTSPTVSPTRTPSAAAASASPTVSPSTSPTASPSRTPPASGASASSTPSPSTSPTASRPATPGPVARTVRLTFSVAVAQAAAAASAPAVLAAVQADVAAALRVPQAWVTVTVKLSAGARRAGAAPARRLAATYEYAAAVAVPTGADAGTVAALNTGLAAIGSASAAQLATAVLASSITAFANANGGVAPTVAAAAAVTLDGAACAAPCVVAVPSAAAAAAEGAAGLSAGAIAGIVVGALALVGAAAGVQHYRAAWGKGAAAAAAAVHRSPAAYVGGGGGARV